ncbi:hypothetical protein Cni_G24184 [Canna indica]|uniref:Uncharacterized protein n=1 Tax=Canna indica TaxID=4628 RepID=A0AAQ3QMX2_9LILI|nr:hypothetical protein Cni_G24184 [Canna indica]
MHKLRLDLVKESEAPPVDVDDEVYEEIEAPKFVDFTVPDHPRPDDGAWFCARVGHASKKPQCAASKSIRPTRPKSAKSRIAGLTTMISVPEKMAKAKLQDHPISSLRSTPSQAKAKLQHGTCKVALTTPRSRQCPANQEGFRSLRNQKEPVVAAKNRIVAKALFSDATATTTKERPEWTTPSKCNTTVSEVCTEMKKLKTGSRVRSVPSRYLCTSNTPKCSKRAEESEKSMKKAEETKKTTNSKSGASSNICGPSILQETNRDKSNDIEADEELDSQSVAGTKIEEHCSSLVATPAKDCTTKSDSMQSPKAESTSLNNIGRMENAQNETGKMVPFVDASSKPDIEVQKEEIVTELDNNKENDLATNTKRVANTNTKKHGSENLESVTKENVARKARRPQIKPSTELADRGKHTRTTNPKPFKLRVDERRILKEANEERRLVIEVQAQKETESKIKHGEEIKAVVIKEKKPQKTESKLLKMASSKKILRDRSVTTTKNSLQTGKENSKFMNPEVELKRKRPATIPKEPVFHRSHLPRSCSKRAEVQS